MVKLQERKGEKGKGAGIKERGVMPCACVKVGKENGMSTCVEKK
jgi:hypothetical protein